VNKNYKALAYLLAANFEAVAVFMSAWYVGGWLNEKYPDSVDWYVVTFSFGIVVIVHSWYRLFVNLKNQFSKK
jgi:hypothetical protein